MHSWGVLASVYDAPFQLAFMSATILRKITELKVQGASFTTCAHLIVPNFSSQKNSLRCSYLQLVLVRRSFVCNTPIFLWFVFKAISQVLPKHFKNMNF